MTEHDSHACNIGLGPNNWGAYDAARFFVSRLYDMVIISTSTVTVTLTDRWSGRTEQVMSLEDLRVTTVR